MTRSERKVILVTGASRGLGEACARHLAERGHRVYGTCRNPDAYAGSSLPFELIRMDITNEKEIDEGVRLVLEREGGIDALVSNAGSGIAGAVEDTSVDEFRAQFETNFFGPLALLNRVLPSMRARGKGRIIVISSMAGRASVPFQGAYSASKFALEGLIEALRHEIRPFGVDATLVEPGDFRTGFTDARVLSGNAAASPYKDACDSAIGVMEKDERNGSDPTVAARLVRRLVEARSTRVRYTVGPAFERIFAMGLERYAPSRLFELFLRKYYRIG